METTAYVIRQGRSTWIETDLTAALDRFTSVESTFPAARWGQVEFELQTAAPLPTRRANDQVGP